MTCSQSLCVEPAEESLSDAWNAWLRQDSAYASHPLVSSSSFWSNAHGDVLSPQARSGPLRQGIATRAVQSPPALQQSSDLEHQMFQSHVYQGSHSNSHSPQLGDQESERALQTRYSTPARNMQQLPANLHSEDLAAFAKYQVSPSSHSQRSSIDYVLEHQPACAVPELEPLLREDTLPSSFHVESVYSHALMRGDTISTWAPGSQQDTARSRRPEPMSHQNTAPSSLASERACDSHAGYPSINSKSTDAAHHPSASYLHSPPRPLRQATAALQQPTGNSSADAKGQASGSTASSASSPPSNFQLTAKHGSKQRTPTTTHFSSSLSHDLPASGTMKQDSSLAIHSAMSGMLSNIQFDYSALCHLINLIQALVHKLVCSHVTLGMHMFAHTTTACVHSLHATQQ